MGEEQVLSLSAEFRHIDTPEVADFLLDLSERLAVELPPLPYEIRVRLIVSEAANAFAVAGGNIYLTTGMLLGVRNVAELASVLAHEMGHVQAGHISQNYNRFRGASAAAELSVVTLALITGNPFLAGAGDVVTDVGSTAYITSHSREAEREADQLAFDLMLAAGYDPRSQLTLLSRLYLASLDLQTAPAFLLTHPLPAERIEDSQVRLANLTGFDALQVNDNGRLETVKRRLLELGVQQPQPQK